MRLPVYFSGVRSYFAVTTALAVLLLVVLLRSDSADAAAEATVLLELLTPLPLLLISAGLLQSDPALSLIATRPVPLGHLLLARWALAITGVLIVPSGAHLVTAFVNPEVSLSVLTWLAPAAFLSALAITAAAVTANTAAGIGTAIGYWAASLLLTPMLQDTCTSSLPAMCTAAVWSSAYSLLAPAGPGWEINRIGLLLGTLALLLIATYTYRNPERQVRATTAQEATA